MNFAQYSIILFILTGCAQDKQNVIVPQNARYVPCQVLTILTYDSDLDTELTVEDIRKYNAVYRALCQDKQAANELLNNLVKQNRCG